MLLDKKNNFYIFAKLKSFLSLVFGIILRLNAF